MLLDNTTMVKEDRFLVELLSWRESKRNGRSKGERGGGEETLARKSCDSGKRPLIFHGLVHL